MESSNKIPLRVIKIPLSLDKETIRILDSQSKITNWLYNKLLTIANTLKLEYIKTQCKKIRKTVYSKRGLRDLIPSLKIEHPFPLS
jgi:hypothetical protein